MAKARQELGPDAMLVSSRKAPPGSGHPGQYEVVFGLVESRAVAQESIPPVRDRLSTDVADLKKELEAMRRAMTRSAFAPPEWLSAAPDLSDAYAILTANEVAPELAREIVHGAEARASKTARPEDARAQIYQRALIDELQSRFTAQPGLGRADSTPRITALVGPPGAGKTTTLVKLAVHYGLAARRPVMLVSMDYLSHRCCRAASSLRRHPWRRRRSARHSHRAGAGAPGKQRQGADPHRHAGLEPLRNRRRKRRRFAACALSSITRRYRHATCHSGIHEARRRSPHGRCLCRVPTAAFSLHQNG
jgi:hypothetical protein